MEEQKERILFITDTPTVTTGLARVCREIVLRFCDENEYEIAIAGWHQAPLKHNFPCFIYPTIKGHESSQQIESILKDYKPDIIVCIGDIWDFSPYLQQLHNYREVKEDVVPKLSRDVIKEIKKKEHEEKNMVKKLEKELFEEAEKVVQAEKRKEKEAEKKAEEEKQK